MSRASPFLGTSLNCLVSVGTGSGFTKAGQCKGLATPSAASNSRPLSQGNLIYAIWIKKKKSTWFLCKGDSFLKIFKFYWTKEVLCRPYRKKKCCHQ
jgi:hypothetical protein